MAAQWHTGISNYSAILESTKLAQKPTGIRNEPNYYSRISNVPKLKPSSRPSCPARKVRPDSTARSSHFVPIR